MDLAPTDRTGWGRLNYGPQILLPFRNRHQALPVTEGDIKTLLPFGNGRSYGDSCLNTGGALIECRNLDHFISFDKDNGVLRCEAGVLFKEILDLIVPAGWIIPAMPGTQFVTVGGAIANDVHGKNHHSAGTFGKHLNCFELLRSDGTHLLCSETENNDLFRATIGGLGLTGIITWADFKLKRIETPYLMQDVIRFHSLEEFFKLAQESDSRFEYTVAWIDCLASGSSLGRGLFMRADHMDHEPSQPTKVPARILSVPFAPPFSLVNALSLRLFNSTYFRKQSADKISGPVHYEPFFFPLDSILHWNRIYGPKGFYQYQCVLPVAGEEKGISEILELIARSGAGSFLTVLKKFGDTASPGMLSFPRHGITLALDFPNKGAKTIALLTSLDEITRKFHGALYPAKDARMSPAMFAGSFPALRDFQQHIDPAFSSSFWRRVTGERNL
jgi:FAD/FMN-containing dehydrogenase